MGLFSKRPKPPESPDHQPSGSLRERALRAVAEAEARDDGAARAAELRDQREQGSFVVAASRQLKADLGVDLSPQDWHVIGRCGRRVYGTVGHNDGVEIGRHWLAYAVVEGVTVHYDGAWCVLGSGPHGDYDEHDSIRTTLESFGKALKARHQA
jgi:hypothetical protein